MSAPFEPGAGDAVATFAPAGFREIVSTDDTIVAEGESAPPARMRYDERVEGATFRATLGVGASQARSDVFGDLARLGAVGVVSAAIGSLFIPIVACVIAWPRLVRAVAVEAMQIELGPERFVVDGKSRGRSECATGALHGFGYRRSALTRSAYDVVVLFRAGLARAVIVPCDSKEQARFLARRLNAALAVAQRAAREATSSA